LNHTVSSETFAKLKSIDSCTVANAIEKFGVRPDTWGFTGPEIRCLFPDQGVTLGYAVTGVMGPREGGEQGWRQGWLDYTQAIEDSPNPAVCVIEDSPVWPMQGALVGEVMATCMKALGAVGCITNGAVRDLEQVREMGFHYHAAGVIVSHGQLKFHSVGQPVRLGRLEIRPGDLLHADLHGVVVVPFEIADRIPEAAQAILDREAEIIEVARGTGFRAADLQRFY
jgi:4-hydroxy-4-methyl-2-oxoglutarate aldolase